MKHIIILFFLALCLDAEVYKSTKLKIIVDLPSSYLKITDGSQIQEIISMGTSELSKYSKKFKTFANKHQELIHNIEQRPIEIWTGKTKSGKVVVIKVIMHRKNLDLSAKNVTGLCIAMNKGLKDKLGLSMEFCKKSKVSSFGAIHTEYSILANEFTSQYMIKIHNKKMVVIMISGNRKYKKEILRETYKIIESLTSY